MPYLKIHGCVSRHNDQQLRFILSSHEYYKFKHRRERLFNYLKDWGREHPIFFVGYSIADENIRDILFDLSDQSVQRPRYVLAIPEIEPFDVVRWAADSIDAYPVTFSDFMTHLDRRISANARQLGKAIAGTTELARFIPSHDNPSPALAAYLQTELSLIRKGMPVETTPPEQFYRGFSESWGWLERSLDIKRHLGDELLIDTYIDPQGDSAKLYLILGYAGSGKTVAIRRFAWSVAHDYDAPIFYLKEGGRLKADLVLELQRLLKSRVFVVVDDVVANLDDTVQLYKRIAKSPTAITIVAAARTNEWNVEGTDLVPFVTKEPYEILDLVESEIGDLVSKLREHRCLGYMTNFSDDEAHAYLRSKLDKQLLVALHEATGGEDFEKIVLDEYVNLVPAEAQRLYLDICTVHRVGVPVRAGTVSRVSGISITGFRERLFKPLEHVVRTVFDQRTGDYVYRTRHPNIAEIVYTNALSDAASRCDQLTRMISSMNLGYSTDKTAVTKLIHSKGLARDFGSKEYAYRVLRAAEQAGLEEEFVKQHIAHFEATHADGNLRVALKTIDEAIRAARNGRPSSSTQHVKAQILRKISRDAAGTEVERDKKVQEARLIVDKLIPAAHDTYPYTLKAALLMDELERRADSAGGSAEASAVNLISDLMRDIESTIFKAKQLFPNDVHVANVQSRFASILEQHPKAVEILERAHALDPSTPFVAIRLAEKYQQDGRTDDGISVLRRTLKSGGPNRDIRFALAGLLARQSERSNCTEIGQHLVQSFSSGDSRY